jgi:hypothetical protein
MKKIFLTILCAVGLMGGIPTATAQSGVHDKLRSATNALAPDWLPPFKFGVTAGLNASTFSHGGFDSRCGYQIGVDGMVDMSTLLDNTYLRTGLQFIRKGAKYESTANVSGHCRSIYLQLPIHYGYGYVIDPNFILFGEAGPYVALGLGGKTHIAIDVPELGVAFNQKSDFFDDADRFDLGFGFHAGVIMYKTHQVSLGYDFGLLNMCDGYAQNRSFLVSYTYYFN